MKPSNKDIAKRIQRFREIRDIPYFISLSETAQDYCCATKPRMLADMLSSLGLSSRRILCTFEWSSLPIPDEVRSLTQSDIDTHEYLEVLIPETGDWVKVCPSWDAGLRKSGLRVSEWDGLSNTTLGVDPIDTFSPEQSDKMIEEEDELDPELRAKYLFDNYEFFDAFNKWMQAQRLAK